MILTGLMIVGGTSRAVEMRNEKPRNAAETKDMSGGKGREIASERRMSAGDTKNSELNKKHKDSINSINRSSTKNVALLDFMKPAGSAAMTNVVTDAKT